MLNKIKKYKKLLLKNKIIGKIKKWSAEREACWHNLPNQ
jgi:hypothetical protein